MSGAFDLYRQRGFEFIQSGRLEEAITELQAARSLNPEDAWTRRSLGAALSQTGQKEPAMTEFREAIRLQPNDEEIQQNLVHSLIKADRSAEALAAVQEALVSCANSAVLYRYLGGILRVEANKTKDRTGWLAAAAAFQQAISIDPNNSNALHSLGVLNWKTGKKREAVTALKAAVAVDPNNLEVLNALGTCQLRTGNLRGAVQTIRAMSNCPDSEALQQYLADPGRTRKRCQFLLSLGAGLAVILAGVWIWRRQK